MPVRYDDMRIDRLLLKEYQSQVELDLKRITGLNDIDILLAEFERIFAGYIGTQYAIAVNSGTDALQLILLALGIGKGDSVIIPDVTYPAVPLSIIYSGAEPVFADIKDDDLQVNEAMVERFIKKNTKAIIAVHMFGRACNIDAILKIAKKHGLFVIEDVCQAESSEYNGRMLGSFADLSAFSFSYYKPLSSCGGGGGMICFNDEQYKRILNYTRVWQDSDELLSAGKRFTRMYLLDLITIKVKFKYLREIIKSRMKIKKIYEEQLSGLKGIRIFSDAENTVSVPQNFVIFSDKKEAVGKILEENRVIWQRPYTPLHLIKNFARFAVCRFPNSERYWKESIGLPLFSFMKTEECLQIVDILKGIIK